MDHSKLARLLFAIRLGDYQKEILNEIDMSTEYPDDLQIPEAGYNCLHLSVLKEDVQLTKKLLDEGADLMKQGSHDGYTPLHLFVKDKLFNKDKKIQEMIGKLEKYQIVDILLSEQIKRDDTLNPKCLFGISHLHIACMVDNLQAVEFFLKARDCANQAISVNSPLFAGWTPLHFAVTYSSTAIINYLFHKGADIHLKDALGKSPLHRLLKRQLDSMDNITMGKRAIVTSIVCEINKLETIIYTLLKSVKTNEVNFVDDAEISAFHVACTMRKSFWVEDLLKGDVDINKPLNNKLLCWAGWTPLHFAACCSEETVKLLVQHGADITIKNTKGETPLDFCMRRYSPDIIYTILCLKEEFKEIILSDQSTKLVDLILMMDECREFNNFLQNLSDINIIVPHDSPIWPGYGIFHLAISMHERTLDPKDYMKQILSNSEIHPKQYTCLEIEEKIYWKRIAVCLARQCNLTIKDANGRTPIHLAFKLLKSNVVDKLLNCCHTNETDPNGLSFLHMACVMGKKNIVERFINDMENPVKTYFKWRREKHLLTVQANSTTLHMAVAFDHHEIVELLLQKEANVYIQDALGLTPIHLSGFSQPMAYLFFDRINNLKEIVSKDGMSHLHVAAFVDDDTAIEKLVKSGANVNVMSRSNIPLDTIDYLKQTPLHIAIKLDNFKAVRALIEAGADIHAIGKHLKYDTPLQRVMRMVPDDITDEFVNKLHREKQIKGPIEACGVTLLHFACAVFDLKWAEKLLKQGADPNAQISMDEDFQCLWKGYTPMHVLIVRIFFAKKKPKNLTSFVTLLLNYGADVTLQDQLGESPVLLAEKLASEEYYEEERTKKHGEVESKRKDRAAKSRKIKNEKNSEVNDDSKVHMYSIADLLLKHQKSYAINPMTIEGLSHLHYACKRNKVGIVKKFLENGVDVNQALDIFALPRNAGTTPLHFALACRHYEIVELLLDYRADVKAKDIFYQTPLHFAAMTNVDNVHILKRMWRMGADVKAKNAKNETPLDLLLKTDFISSDELEFFFECGCLIEFKVETACDGTIGRLLRYGIPDEREQILRLLFQYCNLSEYIKNGFNAIQSFVSLPPDPTIWTVDRYLGGIQFFIDMGCDIDQQTCLGLTASHGAAMHGNLQAVEALLLLGANINLTSHHLDPSFKSKLITESDVPNFRMEMFLGSYMWKMKYTGLEFHEGAMEKAEEFWSACIIDLKLKERCEDELKKMALMKVGEKWTMRDFLSESKIVIEYQTLSLSQRQSIDEVFKCHADLRKMFPEFCGLLMFQYRKAVSNVETYGPVKNAIASIYRLELPDECLEEMLKYFDKWNRTRKLLEEINEKLSEKV